jgi:uncharacterized membrane protein YkoI
MPKHILVLFLIGTTLMVSGTPSTVIAGNDHYRIARRGGGENGISLNEAVQQVKRDVGGRVLSADTVHRQGRTVHRIKVLTPSGQVRIVTIDAQPKGR